MGNYVIATVKSWNIQNSKKLIENYPGHFFTIVTEKDRLTLTLLEKINPEYVFFPHWSWAIPKEIYSNFQCVIFHMTDLPFGRGGSPLQNLLVRGIYETQISALKAAEGMDAGPVYWKEPVNIGEGNADFILRKISDIVFGRMIPKIIEGESKPKEQKGTPVVFARRTPEESEIPEGLTQRQLYDYIRMLDGEGYPAAYRKNPGGRVFYRNARMEGDIVYADAEFRRDG